MMLIALPMLLLLLLMRGPRSGGAAGDAVME